MSNSRQYWQSVEQLENSEEFVAKHQNEFSEELPLDQFLEKEELSTTSTSRRDFLKFVGFSLTAATLAACEAPVMKSIPYVVKPEEVTPGIANYYASSYYDGFEFAPILIKTREGRPIHIEGNKESEMTRGGITARVNSSLLGLYDEARVRNPRLNGEETKWSKVDKAVKASLKSAKKVRILSNSIISPSTQAAFDLFASKLGSEEAPVDFKHVTYDESSSAGILMANKNYFGKAIIPSYRFENAKVVVSFGADFLSTWLNTLEYSDGYSANRLPDHGEMSRHYQFEGSFSLTGTNADIRGAVKPNEIGLAVIALYNEVAKATGNASIKGAKFEDDNDVAGKIKSAAKDLLSHKGKSLVVCGSNDIATQEVVNGLNQMLGSYGKTIDITKPLNIRKSNDQEFADLVAEMKSGSVDTLLIYGVNPVYSAPASLDFAGALSKVKMSVSFSDKADETGSMTTVLAPDNHYFENWNDYVPVEGSAFIAQPVIRPLFTKTKTQQGTRQAQESILRFVKVRMSFYDFMRENWKTTILPLQTKYSSFDELWNNTVHDGFVHYTPAPVPQTLEAIIPTDINTSASNVVKGSKASGMVAELFTETKMGIGNQANNPWLQELPNALTKVTWDNYVAMNPADCRAQGYNTTYGQQLPASLVNVSIGGSTLKLPVIATPGQKIGTVSIALGYGRTKTGRVVDQGDMVAPDGSKTIGANVFPAVNAKGSTFNYYVDNVTIELAEEKEYPVGLAQTHFTEMDRKIVNETSIATYAKGKDVYNPDPTVVDSYGVSQKVEKLDLWAVQDIATGHRWGMTIDLNLCYGCSACVTACHSENNVPVVGKDEVRRNRIMSWLRIDRYFSSDMSKATQGDTGKIDMYRQMEVPSDYPEAVHQPVMCQQCNHAPCETVCPVAATTHSDEGLNQMTYNRCIGTRYCANNCPYKVRRFNWFNYVGDSKFTDVNPSQNDLARMVLNPDVVVRSRGVMEKCSFCVQRIQAGKLEAKKAGRPVQDGEVTSACSAACATGAIRFGDLNDDKTQVSKVSKDERSYHLLEEVGTQPNVFYLTKVRNVDEERIPPGIGHGAAHGGDHGHDAHGGHEAEAHGEAHEEAHNEEHSAH
ncbi:TAT-variant-translocated molybdopterin oxidoreductase [bacterium SCSIO 12643]|nr:TAT-variant-translocated molybdopterin oxidoreductase [bacterium SCSIO 12643]